MTFALRVWCAAGLLAGLTSAACSDSLPGAAPVDASPSDSLRDSNGVEATFEGIAVDATQSDGIQSPDSVSTSPLVIVEPLAKQAVRELVTVKAQCPGFQGQMLAFRADSDVVSARCRDDQSAEVQIKLPGEEGDKTISVALADDEGVHTSVIVQKVFCAPHGHWSHPAFAAGFGVATNPFKICTLAQLQAAAQLKYLGSHFELRADIEAAATKDSSSEDGVVGFRSIGGANVGPPNTETDITEFSGHFDGRGHAIRDLHIEVVDVLPQTAPARPRNRLRAALFGRTSEKSVITNVHLENVEMIAPVELSCGANQVHAAALVAHSQGRIERCSATGKVTGNYPVGGLVGTSAGDLLNCHADVDVLGKCNVGGLAGSLQGNRQIKSCYAIGSVKATSWEAGGLVAHLAVTSQAGHIHDSFAAPRALVAPSYKGGLVGYKEVLGTVTNSFTTTSTCFGNQSGPDPIECETDWPTSKLQDPRSAPLDTWDAAIWTFATGRFPQLTR